MWSRLRYGITPDEASAGIGSSRASCRRLRLVTARSPDRLGSCCVTHARHPTSVRHVHYIPSPPHEGSTISQSAFTDRLCPQAQQVSTGHLSMPHPGCGIHAPVSPGNREQMLVAALGTTSPANPGTLSFRSLQCRFIVTQKQRPGSRNQDFSASGCRLFTHPVPTRHPKRRPVHKPPRSRPYFAPRDDHAPNAHPHNAHGPTRPPGRLRRTPLCQPGPDEQESSNRGVGAGSPGRRILVIFRSPDRVEFAPCPGNARRSRRGRLGPGGSGRG